MLESFEDLISGLGILSNHFKKSLRIVEKNSLLLRQRLDDHGLTGQVHLWRKAQNYRREMEFVMSVSREPGETQIFLGTYFVLQSLQLHFLNIDLLRRHSDNLNRSQVYHQILTRMRFQLRNLSSSYLTRLIQLFAGEVPKEGIAICNVGMIMDQDDLDVGIFIDSHIDCAYWNKVIGQVSKEFLKFSTKMHFYLAEGVASNIYLTTVEDFRNYLERDIHDFVLISELLLTEFLLGDIRLTRRFEEEVIDQFYYETGNSRLHEGYLRSMMGEMEQLLRFDVNTTWVSPKNDGLRLIHNLMSIQKTIFGIREHGTRDVIANLHVKDPLRAHLYRELQDIFDFIEMFFYVYQLVVSVDDYFDISDGITLENLDYVAIVMGYTKYGAVRPALRLMTHYYENIDRACILGKEIVKGIQEHLQKITVFNVIMAGEIPVNYPMRWTDNCALNLLKMFKIFRKMPYWDDVLQIVAENDGRMLNVLLDSLEKLPETRRDYAFKRLLTLLSFDMDSMVLSAVFFSKFVENPQHQKYFKTLKNWLIEKLICNHNRFVSFVELITTHPAELAQFMLTLETKQLLELRRIAKNSLELDETSQENSSKFITLCELLAFSSNNYRRLYARVSMDKPEIVTHVNDMGFLDGISVQLWSELSDAKSPEELKKELSIYYEFSFCRCGLLAINNPGNLKLLYGSYHAFFRRYFRMLYRACQWNIENQGAFEYFYRERDEDDQPIAFFCSGGYAREEAFENDIDLLVVSWDSNPEFITYASRIVNDMNRELRRRGIIPHYRFSDFFNSFVTPINEFAKFLEIEREEDFIEFSLLQGAKLLVGSHTLDLEISKLLAKFLFESPNSYIKKMLSEYESRRLHRSSHRETMEGLANVKEDAGALRDIQMIVSACLAKVGETEPIIWKALQKLTEILPAMKNEFKILERAYGFMRFFRDTYALSLAGADEIMLDRLMSTAHRMGIMNGEMNEAEGTAPKLLNSYKYHRSRARQAIQKISEFLLEMSQ